MPLSSDQEYTEASKTGFAQDACRSMYYASWRCQMEHFICNVEKCTALQLCQYFCVAGQQQTPHKALIVADVNPVKNNFNVLC